MLLARSAKVEVDGKYYGLLLQVCVLCASACAGHGARAPTPLARERPGEATRGCTALTARPAQVLTRVRKYREAVACFELLALDDNFTPNEDHYLAAMKVGRPRSIGTPVFIYS